MDAHSPRDRRFFMSELKRESKIRKKGKEKNSPENKYHSVVKGYTDSLDSDELELYRFMMGGLQSK